MVTRYIISATGGIIIPDDIITRVVKVAVFMHKFYSKFLTYLDNSLASIFW